MAGVVSAAGRARLVNGFAVLLAFGLFERWPVRLPGWISRWGLQVVAVAAAVPSSAAMACSITTIGEPQHWWQASGRLSGFGTMTVLGLLVSPWLAVAALLRQIKEEAHKQALKFELDHSQYERNALDARFRLLQAQVAPYIFCSTHWPMCVNWSALVRRARPRCWRVCRQPACRCAAP